MNAILFSADPKLAVMNDAIQHLRSHQKLYFEVKFPIVMENLPIAAFIHVSGSADKVQYVARVDAIEPFSTAHYENPELSGGIKPSKWIQEWQENKNNIQSEPWKYALVITRIEPVELKLSELRNLMGKPVTQAPQGYYKILVPDHWPGFTQPSDNGPLSPSLAPHQPDPLLRQQVERIAVETTAAYFTGNGYRVDSVEKDNVGWDLNATLQLQELKLEVKGLSGSQIVVELTPNEYAAMGEYRESYRVCVVSKALTQPSLEVFAYSPNSRKWESPERRVLNINELVAARFSVS